MAQLHTLLFILPVLLLLLVNPTEEQPQQISTVDLAALRQIKSCLKDITGSEFFSTWDFAAPDPCSSFAGVTCSTTPTSRRVTILALGTGLSDSPGLAGSLSRSISELTELTQLILYAGIVSGLIPPQIGALKNIRVISLTNNRLTGPIPGSISTLPNLHTLDLSHNQLYGSVPPDLSGLPQLKVLILASNRLSGELISVPTQLLHLDLKINRISGTLPKLPVTLRYLSASMNEMWGPLNGLESLSELVYLDLSMNHFSGPIPTSIFRPSLSSMFLQRNNLSGGVPQQSQALSYGQGSIVDLSHNSLTGNLSPILAGVESLFLNNNRLIGIPPEDYINSVRRGSTRTLYLQHNYMSGFPLEPGSPLPGSVALCLSYNCMVPPVGLSGCPASAGRQLSRPVGQCSEFNNGSSTST